jgi:hypothetical protein
MTISATTEIYNTVFIENYDKLLKFCNNEEDRLQQTFLDVRDRLLNKPFTANTITAIPTQLLSYIKTALYNDWKQFERLKKHHIDITENQHIIDEILKVINFT